MPTSPIITPQSGAGAFGAVPGQIPTPDPYGDLSSVFPNLSGTNSTLSGDIMSQLGGQLSPGTISMLQDQAATYGARNGMPGANATPGTLPFNFGLESLGLTSEGQVQKGIQNYNSTIPTVAGTQTVSPTLQTEINTQNAVDAAAPNPAASASYAQQLFDQYLQQMKGPAGGTGGTSLLGPKYAGEGTGTSFSAAPGQAPINPGFGPADGTTIGYGPGGNAGTSTQGSLPFDFNSWVSQTFGSPSSGTDAGSIDQLTGLPTGY